MKYIKIKLPQVWTNQFMSFGLSYLLEAISNINGAAAVIQLKLYDLYNSWFKTQILSPQIEIREGKRSSLTVCLLTSKMCRYKERFMMSFC